MGSASSVRPNERIYSIEKVDSKDSTVSISLRFNIEKMTEEASLCRTCWETILCDRSPQFLMVNQDNIIRYESYFIWFATVFAEKLNMLHSGVYQLFPDLSSLRRFLMLINSILTKPLHDDADYNLIIHKMIFRNTPSYLKYGDYGVIGEALLSSLEVVLGSQVFNPQMQNAWRVTYNSFITKVVPQSVNSSRFSTPVPSQNSTSDGLDSIKKNSSRKNAISA